MSRALLAVLVIGSVGCAGAAEPTDVPPAARLPRVFDNYYGLRTGRNELLHVPREQLR